MTTAIMPFSFTEVIMTQQTSFTITQIDATGSRSGPTVGFNPHRERNGVFEYSGRQSAVNNIYLASDSRARVTAALRPGSPANIVTKAPRVKRRVTVKAELPIVVTGVDGTSVDYINVDIVISCPVESTTLQLENALHIAHAAMNANYLQGDTPIDDMLTGGNEPY